MVLLNELFEDVTLSNKPLTRVLFKKHGIHILAVGLKKGLLFPEHTTPVKAKLCVLDGEIEFRISNKVIKLSSLDTYEIPVDIPHSVMATADAIFMIIKNTKK
ncbi:cupin domain-containing protein [Rasiella sp. SM2506]|uniref:cupin domain-containing protein n=1 Tax=Rasiella sp. SM2506 TaxID=3423914 RepID=UPI003D7B7F2C